MFKQIAFLRLSVGAEEVVFHEPAYLVEQHKSSDTQSHGGVLLGERKDHGEVAFMVRARVRGANMASGRGGERGRTW